MAKSLCTSPVCEPLITTRNKLLSGSDTPLVFLGDSWIDSNIIHSTVQAAVESVHGVYGGSGWNDIRTFNQVGTWIAVDAQPFSLGVDANHIETTDPDAEFAVSGVGTQAILHYACSPGAGSFEYNFGQGWIGPVSQDGPAEVKFLTTLGGSATSNTTFKIRVSDIGSGLRFVGVDYRIPGGVRSHEMGNGGIRTDQITAVLSSPDTKAMWQQSLKALEPCLLVVLLGTNDQGADVLPVDYSENMLAIKDCAQQACPGLDVILWSAADNNRGGAYGMDEYASALDNVDDPLDCSFCVVNGYETLGPYADNPSLWDNDTHLTDAGDAAYAQPIIDKLV